jgi:hypothetical protein
MVDSYGKAEGAGGGFGCGSGKGCGIGNGCGVGINGEGEGYGYGHGRDECRGGNADGRIKYGPVTTGFLGFSNQLDTRYE